MKVLQKCIHENLRNVVLILCLRNQRKNIIGIVDRNNLIFLFKRFLPDAEILAVSQDVLEELQLQKVSIKKEKYT